MCHRQRSHVVLAFVRRGGAVAGALVTFLAALGAIYLGLACVECRCGLRTYRENRRARENRDSEQRQRAETVDRILAFIKTVLGHWGTVGFRVHLIRVA